jgi:SSS family solute:Na+ symporter
LSAIDLGIILFYLVGLLVVGFLRRSGKNTTVVDFIVGGRELTVPAFVATLVSTWYGGILGVGEYTFRYGISNWLVFGVPYYLAAILFAYFLADKARKTEYLTIPDRLQEIYGRKVAGVGALVVFFMTLPAAYVLMLGVLCKQYFGLPAYVGIIAGTVFSVVYVLMGGFRSVVRTDVLQMALMYLGFGAMLLLLVLRYGGYDFLVAHVPATHFTWHGGNSFWYIAVWYVLSLQTLVEPAFYQRCYAARTGSVARKGILVSVLFWIVFDFLTTATGLYARALLPPDSDPIASFPALAQMVLPTGLYGLFAVALMATIMSTVDSYSFLAASTLGKDVMCGWFRKPEGRINFYTKIGLLVSAVLAIVIALYFDSVIDVWYAFGSVGAPMLLVPLFFSFVGRRRMRPRVALWNIIAAGVASGGWLVYSQIKGENLLGLQPIFPGLLVSLVIFFAGTRDIVIKTGLTTPRR